MTGIYHGWTESDKAALERLARRNAEHERIMQERESAEVIEWVDELPTIHQTAEVVNVQANYISASIRNDIRNSDEGCGNDDLYDWARGG